VKWALITWNVLSRAEGAAGTSRFGHLRLLVIVRIPDSGALYESWSLPFSVLLSTPVAVFGAFAVLWLRRAVLSAFYPAYMVQIENDVYSQIGCDAYRSGRKERDSYR